MSLTYLENRHNIHDSPWTPERVEILSAMWGQGYSASQIAAQFNGSKITRSAVIGKAHRLKLPAREERKTEQRKPRARRSPRPPKWRPPPEPRPLPPPAPTAPHMRSLTFFKLKPHHCRWPLGTLLEPARLFCAADTEGEVYCPFHADLARVQKRRPSDEYDGNKDFSRSIDEAYRAIRERKANGGKGWGGWE